MDGFYSCESSAFRAHLLFYTVKASVGHSSLDPNHTEWIESYIRRRREKKHMLGRINNSSVTSLKLPHICVITHKSTDFVSRHSSLLFLTCLIIYHWTFSMLTFGSRPPWGSRWKHFIFDSSQLTACFHNWRGWWGDTSTFSFIHGLKAQSSHTCDRPRDTHRHTHHEHTMRQWAEDRSTQRF